MSDPTPTWPRRLESASGLSLQLNSNGSLRRMEHGGIVLNLFPGSEVEGGPTNLYLRRLGEAIEWTPLLGPRSPLAFNVDPQGMQARGDWRGLRIELELSLDAAAPHWFWHVTVANEGGAEERVDLVYAQDLALAPYGAIRMNEYYVSQYVDHTPLRHPQRGWLVASRQNLAMDGRFPWTLIGALTRGESYATDALQLHGLATRAGAAPAALTQPSLPGVRRQHEHSMVAIQAAAEVLAPGAHAELGFFGVFQPDHPAATSDADLVIVEGKRGVAAPPSATPVVGSLFSHAEALRCRDLSEDEVARFWGGERRHEERDGAALQSFFTGEQTHVVLQAKELRVLRPHGALVRTGDMLVPDEASLTTTAWMAGVFNCLLTQGHVSINRFLSTTRSYLGLQRAQGQRVFVEADGGWRLLDLPSAWEMRPDSCRWLYAHDGGLVEVALLAGAREHALELRLSVLEGGPRRFLLVHHVALNGDDGAEPVPVVFAQDAAGVAVRAIPESDVGRRFPQGAFRIDPLDGTELEAVGGDELLFLDGASRSQPYLVLRTAAAEAVGVRFTASLVGEPPARGDGAGERATAREYWRALAGPSLRADSAAAGEVARVHDILPWYAHDALVHYLAPRGLEQFSGGGWGTRDVTQGPVELLLALGRWDEMRALLKIVFANQNVDGDWPQWFMFFERERGIRPGDSHGDIVFWPLHALAQYIAAAEDASILDEEVPFFHPEGDAKAERATIWGHCERALRLISSRLIPGTRLIAYGHGDWNDSLQPADPAMRERLCSTWTVTLHHETLTLLAEALDASGREGEAELLAAMAADVKADFLRLLLVDGELAGLAYFQPDGTVEPMLHPRDRATGIHHRLLPMIHAILADLLTPEEAAAHVGLMRAHLLGADGARLFDRPPIYRGGPQQHFQRAESSSFFGREIGLMYTHAHLRYAAAMARYGDADAFFEALRRANPIAIASVVPSAAPRQANCYYSSSDAMVADRYEAAARYDDIRAGRVGYEGGWRVYSSGAGIAFRLLNQVFLGLQRGRTRLGIDPVMPRSLDGLRAQVALAGGAVEVEYRVGARGCGVRGLSLDGAPLATTPMRNPYRTPGVVVAMDALRGGRRLRVELE